MIALQLYPIAFSYYALLFGRFIFFLLLLTAHLALMGASTVDGRAAVPIWEAHQSEQQRFRGVSAADGKADAAHTVSEEAFWWKRP